MDAEACYHDDIIYEISLKCMREDDANEQPRDTRFRDREAREGEVK